MTTDSKDLVPDDQGAITRRSLHVIVIADKSSSMIQHAKIQSLNEAVRNAVKELKDIALTHTEADLMFRVLSFASEAQWETSEAQPIADYQWTDLTAGGTTSLGEAIDLLTDALDNLPPYQYPPVLALVSDGGPTDDWKNALKRLNNSMYGKSANRTVRTAIAIGQAADTEVLAEFTGNPEMVVTAQSPQQLASLLQWATVKMSEAVGKNYSEEEQGSPSGSVTNRPSPPPTVVEDDTSDLF